MKKEEEGPQWPGAISHRIAERLLESRIVLLAGEIDSKVAQSVMAQLLTLSTESDERGPIPRKHIVRDGHMHPTLCHPALIGYPTGADTTVGQKPAP